SPGHSIFFTAHEVIFSLTRRLDPPALEARTALRLELTGASPNVQIRGRGRQDGVTHYLKGNDPTAWQTNVPRFDAVEYHGLYPGIDAVFYENHHRLEY